MQQTAPSLPASKSPLQPVSGNSLTASLVESACHLTGANPAHVELPTEQFVNGLPIHGFVKNTLLKTIASPSPQKRQPPASRVAAASSSVVSSAAADLEHMLSLSSPLVKQQQTKTSLTPWGYVMNKSTPAEVSTGGSSSSSWQTVRAGLLSPPPQLNAAAILFSPPIAEEEETGETAAANGGEEEEEAKEGEEEEQEHEEGEAHGNGGWLVDLVEGWLDPPLPMPNRSKRLSTSDTTTSSSTPTQTI